MQYNLNKCKFIRSRASDQPILPQGEMMENKNFPSGFYWCTCSMGAIGPDDDFVAPEKCEKERHCYEKID